jgi:hypothetical protein
MLIPALVLRLRRPSASTGTARISATRVRGVSHVGSRSAATEATPGATAAGIPTRISAGRARSASYVGRRSSAAEPTVRMTAARVATRISAGRVWGASRVGRGSATTEVSGVAPSCGAHVIVGRDRTSRMCRWRAIRPHGAAAPRAYFIVGRSRNRRVPSRRPIRPRGAAAPSVHLIVGRSRTRRMRSRRPIRANRASSLTSRGSVMSDIMHGPPMRAARTGTYNTPA